jgi:hypothetical protein
VDRPVVAFLFRDSLFPELLMKNLGNFKDSKRGRRAGEGVVSSS